MVFVDGNGFFRMQFAYHLDLDLKYMHLPLINYIYNATISDLIACSRRKHLLFKIEQNGLWTLLIIRDPSGDVPNGGDYYF